MEDESFADDAISDEDDNVNINEVDDDEKALGGTGNTDSDSKKTHRRLDLFIEWSNNSPNLKITNFTPHALKFVWGRLINLLNNPNRMVYHDNGTPVAPRVFDCAMKVSAE